MYPELEVRLCKYVVAVAEELNFSRAAERLHVSQPSLSKQIRDLEDLLGDRIFFRTKRHVSLTDAGKLLVEEARETLRHSKKAVHAFKTFSPAKRLAVGCSPWVNQDVLMSLSMFFDQQFPDLELNLKSAFTREQLELLGAGVLDAALVILPLTNSTVMFEPLLQEPLLVALPARHPLARRKTVELSELSNTPAISFPRELNPGYHDLLMTRVKSLGLEIRVVREVTTYPEALFLVSKGLGFTLVRECFLPIIHRSIVFRTIRGSPLHVETGIAYSPQKQSKFLDAYLAAIKSRKGQRKGDLTDDYNEPLRIPA